MGYDPANEIPDQGSRFEIASKALQAAHDACYKHPERDVLGMSHGAFSGVNKALGIISLLEHENKELKAENQRLKIQIDELRVKAWKYDQQQ